MKFTSLVFVPVLMVFQGMVSLAGSTEENKKQDEGRTVLMSRSAGEISKTNAQRDALFVEIDVELEAMKKKRAELRDRQSKLAAVHPLKIQEFNTALQSKLDSLAREEEKAVADYLLKAKTMNQELEKVQRDAAQNYTDEVSKRLKEFDEKRKLLETEKAAVLADIEKRRQSQLAKSFVELRALQTTQETEIERLDKEMLAFVEGEIAFYEKIKADKESRLSQQRQSRKLSNTKVSAEVNTLLGILKEGEDASKIVDELAQISAQKQSLSDSPFAAEWSVFTWGKALEIKLTLGGEEQSSGKMFEELGMAVEKVFKMERTDGFSIADNGDVLYKDMVLTIEFFYFEEGRRERHAEEIQYRLNQKFLWSVMKLLSKKEYENFQDYDGKTVLIMLTDYKTGVPYQEFLSDESDKKELRELVFNLFKALKPFAPVDKDGDFIYKDRAYRMVFFCEDSQDQQQVRFPEKDQKILRQRIVKQQETKNKRDATFTDLTWEKLGKSYAEHMVAMQKAEEPISQIKLLVHENGCEEYVLKMDEKKQVSVLFLNNGQEEEIAIFPVETLGQIACNKGSLAYIGTQWTTGHALKIMANEGSEKWETKNSESRDKLSIAGNSKGIWIIKGSSLVQLVKASAGSFEKVLSVEDRVMENAFQVWAKDNDGKWTESFSTLVSLDGKSVVASLGGTPPEENEFEVEGENP